MRSGRAIVLKYEHDYVEDSIIVYSCNECSIYLIGKDQNEGAFVKLKFDGTKCVRSARTDCSPAIGIYPEVAGSCYIVELTDSKWASEAHALYVYAGSNSVPKGRHFVVTNHDIFHEVLADSFSESLIQAEADSTSKCNFILSS